jgi:hypothetical protein
VYLRSQLTQHRVTGTGWSAPGHGRTRLKLIDHGFAFRQWPGRAFASSFEEAKRAQELPDEFREQIGLFLESCEEGELTRLLEPEILRELVDRGQHLVQSGSLGIP